MKDLGLYIQIYIFQVNWYQTISYSNTHPWVNQTNETPNSDAMLDANQIYYLRSI